MARGRDTLYGHIGDFAMRVLRYSLLVSLLGATFALAPIARAHDPAERSPQEAALEKAERIEAEGRSMIEHGHKAEGAKTIAQAWRIRAEVWGAEQQRERPDEPRPEIAALKERVEQLKVASNAAEKAGHELKAAGKVEEANAKMEESGRLWREMEAIQKKLETRVLTVHVKSAADREVLVVSDEQVRELKEQAARAREEAKEAAVEAESAESEGRETAAKAALERAFALKAKVKQLESALRGSAERKKDASPAPTDGVEAKMKALEAKVNEMRALLEKVLKRLGDQDK